MFEIATEKFKSICNAAFPNEFVKNWYDYWAILTIALLWSSFIGMVREQEKTYEQKSCVHVFLALGVPNCIASSFSAQT